MILMKDILKDDNEKLRNISTNVTIPLNNEDKTVIKDMIGYIYMSQNKELAEKYKLRSGVGIAAPQINVFKRMFAFLCITDAKDTLYAIVNPVISKKSTKLIYLQNGEGCLSVEYPTEGVVLRHESIEVACHIYDANADKLIKKILKLKGYPAIVFQHEFDHLDGILYTDKLELNPPTTAKAI